MKLFALAFAERASHLSIKDHVFEQILYSSSPELADARQILHNVICRRLYKCLGQTQAKKPVTVTQVRVCVFAR